MKSISINKDKNASHFANTLNIHLRLEQKIKDLESQLDDEQRRLVDAQKAQRRTDRRIKELTFSQDEDHKNHERMQELVDKLQNKVDTVDKEEYEEE